MTLNCHGNLLDLTVPKVMGILNVTPDSFYDGGSYSTISAVVQQAESMLDAEFNDDGDEEGGATRCSLSQAH